LADAESLWRSNSIELWSSSLQAYEHQVHAVASKKSKADLVKLDSWYRQLHRQVSARKHKRFLHLEELSRIMMWKLARGKFRPGLQGKVDSNSDVTCKEVTEKAFEEAENVQSSLESGTAPDSKEVCDGTKRAIEILSKGPPKLKGVGPATASALLAALYDSFPFMSDEALHAALKIRSPKYNAKEYMSFCEELRCKAGALNNDEKALGSGSKKWTAAMVEMALWSAAINTGPATAQPVPKTDGEESKTAPRKRLRSE